MASRLINLVAVKDFALAVSRSERGGKFTQVGAPFLDRVEAALRKAVRDEVQRHPSVGKRLL